jgi:phage tail protein X
LAASASALELGEIRIHSTLGQPLRASVAYALQPNEQIHDYCIYLRPGMSASGLPSISNAAVSVGDGAIQLTGRTAIREPLLTLQLTVDCPYAAHLRREYSVFVDPQVPSQAEPAVVADARQTPVETVRRVRPATSPRAAMAVPAAGAPRIGGRSELREPIRSSGTYRVQPGDTLSGIASRIPGRVTGIWPTVDAIFAANADAFIDNDRNLLRAGAVLAIPDAILAKDGTGTVRPASDRPVDVRETSAAVAQPAAVTAAEAVTAATPSRPAAPGRSEAEEARDPAESQVYTARPGDATADSDSPFLTPAGGEELSAPAQFGAPVEVIPETTITDAATTKAVAVARSSSSATSDSWPWLMWLGGSGIVLILALLLFGRKLKGRFAPASASAEAFARRRTDRVDLEDTDVSPALALPSQGTAPVARMVSLDADLEDGSGFQYGGDIDVAQDFGFSDDSGQFASGIDVEFSSAEGDASEAGTTDIIAPRRVGEATILVSETPPQHDDSGEYDVSMIVDATKQRLGDTDATTKDLRAIEVDAEDDDTVSDQYTLNHEVDYKVLEQDYQDELTATQALNAEIAKAAQALSRQFGKNEMGDTLTDTMNEPVDDNTFQLDVFGTDAADDETTALPTAEPARAADDTAQMPATANLDDTANEQLAVGMPAAENDSSVEVEIESATIDTRKMRAS